MTSLRTAAWFVLAWTATVADAISTCPQMTSSNIFIAYRGPSSNCTHIGGNCSPNENVAFAASAFGYDLTCASHSFSWNFGDGGTGSGRELTHAFAASGTYTVTLSVTNGTQTFSTSVPVTIGSIIVQPPPPPPPPPPTCPTMTPSNVFINYRGSSSNCRPSGGMCVAGESVTLTATEFGYNFSCVAHTFTWDFGDGQAGNGREVSHVFAASGRYPVLLTIRNPAQALTISANISVASSCPAITVSGNPQNGTVGAAYSAVLSASGGVEPYTYSVVSGTLPPGITLSGSTLAGTPSEAGTYTFTVAAQDSTGCAGVNTFRIVVAGGSCPLMVAGTNVHLTYEGARSSCSQSSPAPCTVTEPIEFRATAVGYPFGCGSHAFTWDFGDGVFAGGEKASHAYAKTGTYLVRLVITNQHQAVGMTRSVSVGAGRRRAAR